MSLVEKYAPQLPYLRRFARALTGTQTGGDAYVRTALQALVAGDVDMDDSLSPKIALFQMFLGIWNTTGAQLESDDVPGADAQSVRIHKLTPTSRQAFLLNACLLYTSDAADE